MLFSVELTIYNHEINRGLYNNKSQVLHTWYF